MRVSHQLWLACACLAALALVVLQFAPGPRGGQRARGEGSPRQDFVAIRSAAILPEAPKMVLALYPSGGRLAPDHLQERLRSGFGLSRDGALDQSSAEHLRSHLRRFRQAGVDVVVYAWSLTGDPSFRTLRSWLSVAREEGLRCAVRLEDLRGPGDVDGTTADLAALAGAIQPDPAYLKLLRYPVVFISTRAQLQLAPAAWAEVLVRLHKQHRSRFVTIGHPMDDQHLAVFDGFVSTQGEGAGLPPYGGRSRRRKNTRILVATVCPRGTGSDEEYIARYRTSWTDAMNSHPSWILLGNCDEELDPSRRLLLNDAEAYLHVTTRYAAEFKRGS